jgi:hypothetical protein
MCDALNNNLEALRTPHAGLACNVYNLLTEIKYALALWCCCCCAEI